MRNRGGLKMLSLQADWIHPLRRRGLWSVGRWFGRRGFHNVRLSLHIHFRKRQTVRNRWSGFRMTLFVILKTTSWRLFSKNNSIRMRISLPAYRKPAPGCGRTSSAAKKTFSTLLKRLLVLEDSNPFETKGMPLKPKPVFKNGDLNPRKSLMRCYSCQPRLKTL